MIYRASAHSSQPRGQRVRPNKYIYKGCFRAQNLPNWKDQGLFATLQKSRFAYATLDSHFSKRLSLLLDMHKKPTLYREIRDKKQKIEEKTGKKDIGTVKKEKEEW